MILEDFRPEQAGLPCNLRSGLEFVEPVEKYSPDSMSKAPHVDFTGRRNTIPSFAFSGFVFDKTYQSL